MTAHTNLPSPPRFFEARRKIFAKSVRGPFRRFKWAVMAVTLFIYYVTPWLRWDRGPFAPNQAVLVDLEHRRFYMFAIEIWPHEFYYVAGLLVMAAIGLFLVTTAVGRAWCGYACPQTVWTDLFQHVERLIEGDRNAQIRLARAPWSTGKVARRVAKHASWIAMGFVTGGAWVFYFSDAPGLARDLIRGGAPAAAYLTIAVLTATTYTLGGLMREQVCQFMCPWPRIQAAMMDERSLGVTYKFWRGEPRSHGLKRAQTGVPVEPHHPVPSLIQLAQSPSSLLAPTGDCIDCGACVAVCPTGIDIREGSQIGCITCGLCIDACDEMMIRVGRPTKLIGYMTEIDARAEQIGGAAQPALHRLLRPRTIAYLSIWTLVGLVMLFSLGARTRIDLSVLQNRNPLWVRLSDGTIRNTYQIKIRNMEARPRVVEVTLTGIAGAMWDEQGNRKAAGHTLRVTVEPDQVTKLQLFVAAPAAGPPRTGITFSVRALDREGGGDMDQSFFERPEAQQ